MGSATVLISSLLADSGLTKTDLSRRSGVSRALLDDYLKGRTQPSLRQLERLGLAAGLRLETGWRPVETARPSSTPTWAQPGRGMEASPTSVSERAEILERVVPVAVAQRRRPAGHLEFPPFRTLRARAEASSGGG